MNSNESIILDDYMTNPEMPFHSQIAEIGYDNFLHSHNFYEIFYILEGSITHVLNGETQELYAGDIIFLNRHDVHSFLREPGNTCKHRDIIIRPELFTAVCEFIGEDFKTAYDNDLLPKKVSLPHDQIERYEQRIVNVILTADTHFRYKDAIIRTLCASLLNRLIEEAAQHDDSYYPIWFKGLLSRFHMNEFFKAGLDKILEPYHFTRPYMCRVFQHYMGRSMTEYLNDIRLQHATYLLKSTDETITSICNTVGFSTASYFNRVFKKKFGITPHAFRRQAK